MRNGSMRITINDQRIDYDLEQEKVLGDVIKSLERLASSNGSVIESISLDDRAIPLDEESPEFKESLALRLEDVGELRVMTLPRPTLAVRSVGTLSEYCATLLGKCAELSRESADLPRLSDGILEGAALLREGFQSTLDFLGVRARMVTDGGKSLADAIARLDQFTALYGRRYIDGSGIGSLREIVKELEAFLPKVLKWVIVKGRVHSELLEPCTSEILDDLGSLAESSLPQLERIGKDLHVGEDRRALENVTALVELLDEIVALFRVSGVSADEAASLFRDIRSSLREMEDALINGDMVTLADSLEYELKPRFERLIGVLKKVHFSVDIHGRTR
jgi:hypothetical protein